MNAFGAHPGPRRNFRLCLGAGLLGFVLSATAARADFDTFLKRILARDVEVIAVTDMTDAGKALRHPSKAQPMYYEALVLGYMDFGRAIAGTPTPNKDKMLKLILKLLADQGYYPANRKHPPEMLLALRWGTMNETWGMALSFMGGEKLDLMWQLEPLSINTTMQHMTQHMHGPLNDFVSECATGDLYVISIMCFDEQEALKGKTKLLWHTKASCPANGLDIEPTLRQMARQAAPMIGRETEKPVWKTAPQYEGHVELGEMRVVDEIQTDKLPITDASEDEAAPKGKK